MCQIVAVDDHGEEPSMKQITTIGLDIAKHVFQVHGVNESAGSSRRLSPAIRKRRLVRR